MTEQKELQLMNFAEFEAMAQKEGWNYELIDGMVLLSPRPSLEHQNISGNLYFELRRVLTEAGKDCKPVQEVDLVLEENNLIPDLMVICGDALKGKRYEKPPMLVIEIISPTSVSRDYITKRYKYEQLGVQEYWVVSPEEACITVMDFTADTCEMYCAGQVRSSVLPEIVIELNHIFM